MNSYNFIFFPIILMILIAGFYQVVTTTEEPNLNNTWTNTTSISGNQTLNGTEQEIEIESQSFDITFTMETGFIVIIATSMILALIGTRILGSGLSEQSVRIIWNGTVFYGLWGILSVITYDVFEMIPLFGLFSWFILTAIYSLGVFSRMSGE